MVFWVQWTSPCCQWSTVICSRFAPLAWVEGDYLFPLILWSTLGTVNTAVGCGPCCRSYVWGPQGVPALPPRSPHIAPGCGVWSPSSRAGRHSCGDDLCPLQGFQLMPADLSPSHILSEVNSSSHISPEELDLLSWMLSFARGLQTTPRIWRTSHPYPQTADCWDSGPALWSWKWGQPQPTGDQGRNSLKCCGGAATRPGCLLMS